MDFAKEYEYNVFYILHNMAKDDLDACKMHIDRKAKEIFYTMENKKDYLLKILEALVNIPSPSGFTKKIMEYLQKEAEGFGFECNFNKKGGLIVTVPGKNNEAIGLLAHADTLGAMVRSIDSNGNLLFSSVGGFTLQSVEGTYCKIHTRENQVFTGTILTKSPAVHSYDDARTLERTEKNMLIRLDEEVKSKEEVLALGINSGDYISFDAMYRATESGFINSRHLDDKASVAVLFTLLKEIADRKLTPESTLKIMITNYEEVGYGASFIPENVTELLAVDMGSVGDDLNGNEYSVSICAKDSHGPYDYDMTTKLITLAKDNNIPYTVDIFPHYGSDVSAALKGGNDIRGALIGQGVHASHGTERTHMKGLMATFALIKAYIAIEE